MRKKWPKTESDLAEVVVNWLQDLRWEIYQEVQFYAYGRIADIVAVQNNLVWIVETKKTMTLAVIEQAEYWKGNAHYVSIAVPYANWTNKGRSFAYTVCKKFGVGAFIVSEPTTYTPIYVIEKQKPQFNRYAKTERVFETLSEEHKTFAKAGNPDNKRWTPFQKTSKAVVEEVCKNPGLTLKELIDRVDTHYSSTSTAKTCIAKYIRDGIIKGLRTEQD